ncbi:Ku protein [Pseudoroseomonas wenyumeiae]|uniref:Non-homologous end joining protein Ku n=1 Tax=Teichococcus wenyumeiae TaxID=2478470 RepID=A0A3A9JNF8_9PROT|nr:Ku protein [Pseudoroseomonas wenyumeiae]RKK06045.1 Ku protein [Pseudoroseomonas wenyumeiae]RMI19562.1 Ku protein [Pseudoroseomonas wenyumeiae]
MSERPIWRGTLRLALVSCRIALVNAHHERNNLHFHLINPKTGNRIRTQTVDAETGKEVERGDLARGYEYEKGEYVILTEEDFDSARVESSSTLNIAKFVPASSVGPLYVDNSYYVVPDDDDSADVYAVLREALQESGMMALSRLVLFRRERAVGIVPLGKGLVLHTLHEESDLRPAKSAFEDVPKSAPDKEMVKLARQLIERQEDEFDPSDTEDRYEARLREVIEARKEGKPAEPEPEEQPDRGNVIDLMAALLNSLKQGEPRKAPARKPAPRKAAPKKAAPARKKRA